MSVPYNSQPIRRPNVNSPVPAYVIKNNAKRYADSTIRNSSVTHRDSIITIHEKKEEEDEKGRILLSCRSY